VLGAIGIAAIVGGVIGAGWALWHRPDAQAEWLEARSRQRLAVFSDLRTSYGWHDFLDGRTPSDPMRRIEKWRDRTGHLIPARDREAWDRICRAISGRHRAAMLATTWRSSVAPSGSGGCTGRSTLFAGF